MIVPICAAQAATAASVGQTSSAVRPDGKVIVAVSTQSGAPLRDPLLVERVAVRSVGRVASLMPGKTPLGQRSSVVGRS